MFTWVTTIIGSLISVAFATLLERKTLRYTQNRKGPNKVSISGILQPAGDGVKLLFKAHIQPVTANSWPFIIGPASSFILFLLFWLFYSLPYSSLIFLHSALLIVCVSSLKVYTLLTSGWSRNSKYSLLGALRATAQTISYEVSLVFLILFPISTQRSRTLTECVSHPSFSLWLSVSVLLLWVISFLAERNRAPFDFAEGERELVSGFNTEYASIPFTLLFLAEYGSIIFFSWLTTLLFLHFFKLSSILFPLCTSAITYFTFWVRATLPRFRYDFLMSLCWKGILPLIIIILCLVFSTSFSNP